MEKFSIISIHLQLASNNKSELHGLSVLLEGSTGRQIRTVGSCCQWDIAAQSTHINLFR